MKRFLYICMLLFVFTSCKEPEARRPIHAKTTTFFDASVARNKKMLALEEAAIKTIMANDSLRTYYASTGGFWYCYEIKDSTNSYTPVKNDIVQINYEIRTLDNDIIYSRQQIGNVTIKMDSEIIFPGLTTGIKLMKKGETVTFLFPSALAYGYHGDNDKIGVTIPIRSTVSLIDIIKTSKDSILN